MNTTRRAATMLMATAVATGAIVPPTAAKVPPPEPGASGIANSALSPAMTTGRAWCSGNGIDYQTLWIQ